MARRKRGKRAFNVSRVLVSVAVILVLIAAGWFGYGHFDSQHAPIAAKIQPEPPPGRPIAPSRVTLSGQLSAAAPVRDAQIGIGAHAAMLLRHVEVFAGDDGHGAWSDPTQGVKAPFADARFVASELRLEGLSVDPVLLERQLKPVDYPVMASDLPPNMAATFTVRDGALYAGGDPAHPAQGTVRISYRVIPTGTVTLSGLRKGTHLTQ